MNRLNKLLLLSSVLILLYTSECQEIEIFWATQEGVEGKT